MPPQRRIIDDALYVHFVTFSVDRRRRLLDHDHPKRIVLGVLTKLLRGWPRLIALIYRGDAVTGGLGQ